MRTHNLSSRKGARDAWVWESPRVGPQPVTWPFLVRAGEPCEPLTRSGTPLLRRPRSYWQEQETPTTQPLLLTLLMRWTLGDSLLIEIPQALLPVSVQDTSCLSDLLSTPLGILSSLHFVWTLKTPFQLKGGRKPLSQTDRILPNRPNQSGINVAKLLCLDVASSNLPWDIFTGEGLTLSSKFKLQIQTTRGAPVISGVLFGYLLLWSFEESS